MGQQQDTPDPGFVATERTDETTVTTVIVTADGADTFPCPGGLTADELTD